MVGFAWPVTAGTCVNGLKGIGLYMNIHKLLMALIYWLADFKQISYVKFSWWWVYLWKLHIVSLFSVNFWEMRVILTENKYKRILLRSAHTRDLSHEQFTWGILRNKSQGLVLKIQTDLNSRDWEDQSWSLQLDFEAKMASSHDGTCPCDLLQGLATGFSGL